MEIYCQILSIQIKYVFYISQIFLSVHSYTVLQINYASCTKSAVLEIPLYTLAIQIKQTSSDIVNIGDKTRLQSYNPTDNVRSTNYY
jgi:hypothetical protein